VMVMGMGISGGYTDKGTPGTDKDTYIYIRHHTHTHIRHTRTHHGGFILKIDHRDRNQKMPKQIYIVHIKPLP